ncbi:hypothetical protein [Iamia sp.]|uniref:hypothetical protein n=1 Tax=Iamia sp. TaxID=2722710 RepID=UPI002BA442D8|nr:hypothetical protein [Iamia sp.]HXH57037.1 hypothetical protein [Iamia sp.]
METALPIAALIAAGVAVGRWAEGRDLPVVPAVGTAMALPGRVAGKVAAGGLRVTGTATMLVGAGARQAAGGVERLVDSGESRSRR